MQGGRYAGVSCLIQGWSGCGRGDVIVGVRLGGKWVPADFLHRFTFRNFPEDSREHPQVSAAPTTPPH
jgi:hypothetical protein